MTEYNIVWSKVFENYYNSTLVSVACVFIEMFTLWLVKNHIISCFIIHQIFSLTFDWSKHVTWPNIPEYFPNIIILKTLCIVKKIWRIIKTIASIWGKNMLGYLSLDITLFLIAHSFPRASLSETCSLLGTSNVFDYCLCYHPVWGDNNTEDIIFKTADVWVLAFFKERRNTTLSNYTKEKDILLFWVSMDIFE